MRTSWLVVVAAACGREPACVAAACGVPGDSDADVVRDSDTTVDGSDSGADLDEPWGLHVFFVYEFAVNDDGELAAFTRDGENVAPNLKISASETDCEITIDAPIAALQASLGSVAVQPPADGLTATGQALHGWRDAQGMAVAVPLGDGVRRVEPSDGCESWGIDVPRVVGSTAWTLGAATTMTASAERGLAESGLTVEDYSGDLAPYALGGSFGFPDGYFVREPTYVAPTVCFAFALDDAMAAESDATGNPVWLAPATLADSSHGVARAGFVCQPLLSVLFGPPSDEDDTDA